MKIINRPSGRVNGQEPGQIRQTQRPEIAVLVTGKKIGSGSGRNRVGWGGALEEVSSQHWPQDDIDNVLDEAGLQAEINQGVGR